MKTEPKTFYEADILLGYLPNSISAQAAISADAYQKLRVLASAWNMIDDFEPSIQDATQVKFYPVFMCDTAGALTLRGLRVLRTTSTRALPYGNALCFKTRKRANEFGSAFIGLWNDYLTYNREPF